MCLDENFVHKFYFNVMKTYYIPDLLEYVLYTAKYCL